MKLKKEDPNFNFIPEHDRQADERKPYYLRVGFNKSTGTSDPRNEEQLHTPAELVKGVCSATEVHVLLHQMDHVSPTGSWRTCSFQVGVGFSKGKEMDRWRRQPGG